MHNARTTQPTTRYLCFCLLLAAPWAVADEVPPVEEIIVTAQKRSESQQSVPFSLSVVSEATLQERGDQDFKDFARSVPSLSFIDLGPGQSQLSIRGINTGLVARDDTARKETVGVYLNEVPVSIALFNPDLDTYDVARVEVLRGPQGTLYGAGSLSGTVRMLTNQPDVREPQGSVYTLVSSTRDGGTNYAAKGAVNLPLVTNVLAARLVGYDDYNDGYIDDIGLGRSNVNDAKKYGGRVSIKYTPNEQLMLLPMVIYQRINTGGFPLDDRQSILGTSSDPAALAALPAVLTRTPDPLTPGQTLIGNPVGGTYEQYRQRPEGLGDTFKVYSLEADYQLGWASLTSSSSYLDRDLEARRDFTYFMNSVFGAGFNYSLPASELLDQTGLATFSQELRLASTAPGRFRWITGAFYQHEARHYTQSIFSPGFQSLTGIPADLAGLGTDVLYVGQFDLRLRQTALFGEGTWNLTDKLALTGGLRWYDYSQSRDSLLQGLFNNLQTTAQTTSTSAHGFNPKYLLAYAVTEDALLSLQASRGFRLGGPSDPVPGICAADAAAAGISSGQFQPETLWNYELGLKTAWADRRLIVNGDVFDIEYSNLQLNRRLPCSFTVTTNGGKARSRGVELEVSGRAATHLDITLGTAYTDAKILTTVPSLNAAADDRLPLAPRVTLSAAAHYTLPLRSGWSAYLDVSNQYIGSVIAYFNSLLPGSPPIDAQSNQVGGYNLLNLRIGAQNPRFEAVLFATNLLDRRADILIDRERVGFITAGAIGQDARVGAVRNQPRTLGVELKARF
jgi:iron complex outermembrane recepter protein